MVNATKSLPNNFLFDRVPMLLALGIDVHIPQDHYLAGEADVGVLFAVAAQPELFHKGEGVGIC
jgi:hypothetical protein